MIDEGNPPEVYCEDSCTDGHKCLTNDWFVCKWKQTFNPNIICCLNRRTDDQSFDSIRSFATFLQTNCANTRRLHNVVKRGFLSFIQSLIHPKSNSYRKESHFPWMVSVLMFGRHVCGGSVISHNFVVTAAHCFVPLFDSSVYTLKIGSNILGEGQELSVSRIITHELYFASESYHDIALIVTKTAINFANRIDIICLPNSAMSADKFVGLTATVVGFGHKSYNGFVSQTLKQIKTKIISNTECAQRYAIGDKHNIPIGIQQSMICAGADGTDGSDACQGDSGGPMTATIDGVNYLIGIVSFGRKCGSVSIPGVYTNVMYYRKWIFERLTRHESYDRNG